ncbi:SF1B family DNA helicase RecD2 [Chlorobium ferrooxidans]|uniref:ATP-dependent RecD2 DNA helicase n=1 Tax=Chlorobium ferrooxidans DSM 13031 TaxID=377431 RepID=Q0YSA7_9CHLB|nr:ATP-dependent RecD-like DNA helicase [Chlorobium ferrooxidans]EAT59085.1 Helicase RecD/TraA [Chlorobium ferrooxidans DSM 13031]
MSESNSANTGEERLSGVVEKVSFFSPASGFAVLRLLVNGQREAVTVVGVVASVTAGQHVEAFGLWQNDKTWGMQFKASRLAVIPPDTLEGVGRYLASGMVKGIGPHFAKVLIQAYGMDVFTVIETHPERLLELPGIGRKRLEQVVAAWAEQKAVREIMVFLQSHGVGTARAVKIYRTYGEEAISVVSSNPYRLTLDIQGIGFKTADQIARNIGIASDSPLRARAGVAHVLQELSLEGHCRVPEPMLLEAAKRLLSIPVQVLEHAITEELSIGTLVRVVDGGESSFYLAALFRAESRVADSIHRILKGRLPWGTLEPLKSILAAEEHSGIELSDSQRSAVALALTSKLIVITGGPGVGKTTIINTILSILGSGALKFVLCAPTGRAAKRLSEATGREAKTIHRILEFDPHAGDFKRTFGNPLQADVVIVDEASMIDVVLMSKLLAAIPDHAALMLAGDVDQLPPVGPGFVLSDMISCGALPVVRLTEIFRQAQSSMIIVNAHRINRGEPVLPAFRAGGSVVAELSDFYVVPALSTEDINRRLLQVIIERIPLRFNLDPMKDIQVLTPMNRGSLGTKALNTLLQEALNPHPSGKIVRFGTTYAAGDKVIQMVNNYDKEVFNGDIGVVYTVNEEDDSLCVRYDGRDVPYEFGELDEIALAYAITIHKSQGSEYPAVVIPLSMQHFSLLERNLIYTAVTRARKLVMIIGEPRALAMAISNKRSSERLTGLTAMISEGSES